MRRDVVLWSGRYGAIAEWIVGGEIQRQASRRGLTVYGGAQSISEASSGAAQSGHLETRGANGTALAGWSCVSEDMGASYWVLPFERPLVVPARRALLVVECL